MDSFADDWIAESLDVTSLTGADREQVVAGIRRCYLAAGLDWPGHVIWVGSPRELTIAADASTETIEAWLRQPERAAEHRATVAARVSIERRRLALGWLLGAVGVLLPAALIRLIEIHYGGQVGFWAVAVLWVGSGFGVMTAAFAVVFRDVFLELPDAARREFLYEDVGDKIRDAIVGRHEDRPRTSPAARAASQAVSRALAPVWEPIWRGWRVAGGSYEAQVITFTRELDYFSYPVAFVYGLDREDQAIRGPHRDAIAGWREARRAGAWIAYRSLVIVCEPPRELHVEQVGPVKQVGPDEQVGPVWRVHNATGPAVVWSANSGDLDHYLHGVRVQDARAVPPVRVPAGPAPFRRPPSKPQYSG